MPQSNVQENKMGVLPVPKLLFQMSLPMILSMLVQALYNIVDSFFIGRYSGDALTALSVVFPILQRVLPCRSLALLLPHT